MSRVRVVQWKERDAYAGAVGVPPGATTAVQTVTHSQWTEAVAYPPGGRAVAVIEPLPGTEARRAVHNQWVEPDTVAVPVEQLRIIEIGGFYFYTDDETTPPDAFFVDRAGALMIDPEAMQHNVRAIMLSGVPLVF